MCLQDLAHVRHATVAEFNGVSVNQFVEVVVRWEVPVQYVKELTADVGCNVRAVWRVEPGYVSFSAPLLVVIPHCFSTVEECLDYDCESRLSAHCVYNR